MRWLYRCWRGSRTRSGQDLAEAIAKAPQIKESDIRAQRIRVAQLKTRLLAINEPNALDLLSVVDHLVRRSIWIVGGDGWAYDIGYGGLDHVLATARDVNVLVLDTEVYSNTGGQASKATPLGAVAKFASSGKRTARKDLALQAIAYGNVYVAQVAMGANPQQTLQAFREAEAYAGPSLILAYSHCIAHGIDMRHGMQQQNLAAASGYWPLFRFNPMMRTVGENPFILDSPRPRIPLKAYAYNELRYSSLARSRPEEADALLAMAQAAVTEKYRQYEELARRDGSRFHPDARGGRGAAAFAEDGGSTPSGRGDPDARRITRIAGVHYGIDHQLSRPDAEEPLDRIGLLAEQPAGQYPPSRGRRRRRDRAAFGVPGADRGGS